MVKSVAYIFMRVTGDVTVEIRGQEEVIDDKGFVKTLYK